MIYDNLPYGALPIYNDINYCYDWNLKNLVKSDRYQTFIPMKEFFQPIVEDIVWDVYNKSKSFSDHEIICVYHDMLMTTALSNEVEVYNTITLGFGLFKSDDIMELHIPYLFRKNKLKNLISDLKIKVKIVGDKND